MKSAERDQMTEQDMRAHFEASLPQRIERASRVKLQNIIPAQWFAAAASECAGMYVAGFFYGSISVAQAYVEALSRFLAEHHSVRTGSDVPKRCQRLNREGFLSHLAFEAAIAIFDGRNDFHHLNRDVQEEFDQLQSRAEQCINSLHTIESDTFAYSYGDTPGKVVLHKPEYWPSEGPDMAKVNLRQLW